MVRCWKKSTQSFLDPKANFSKNVPFYLNCGSIQPMLLLIIKILNCLKPIKIYRAFFEFYYIFTIRMKCKIAFS